MNTLQPLAVTVIIIIALLYILRRMCGRSKKTGRTSPCNSCTRPCDLKDLKRKQNC